MSETNVKKRKSKGKWHQPQSKKRKFAMCPGLKGFLLFCNNKERETIREAYNILNEYADQMYGQEDVLPKVESISNGDDEEIENEIEDELDREKTMLQAQADKKESERRFQVIESGIQNVLFVRTTVKEPVELVVKILKDIAETKTQKCRHLIRLIPIQRTCKAFEGPVKEAVKSLLMAHYNKTNESQENNEMEKEPVNIEQPLPSYCVIFKARLNQNFYKQDAIDVVGDIMKEICPNAKVSYKNPDLAIVFEVMKNHCCLSVLPQYYDYKKYNLIELVSEKTSFSTPEEKLRDMIPTSETIVDTSLSEKTNIVQ